MMRGLALTINARMVKFAFHGNKIFVSRVEARPSRVAESENVKSSTMTGRKGEAAETREAFFRRCELVAVAKSAGLSPTRVESYDGRAECFMREKFLDFRGPVVCFAAGPFFFGWDASCPLCLCG
jgi:hypothetical protein